MSGTRNLNGLRTQVIDCIESAYIKGYEAAKQDIIAAGNKSEYERGLKDAEKARSRLVSAVSNGGLSEYELEQIFDLRDYGDVLTEYTIPKIIEKIREYDEKKAERNASPDNELHIGDEVYIIDQKHRSVVTSLLDNGWKVNLLCASGNYTVVEISKIHKTGRRFAIDEVLRELRGE